MRLLVMLAVVSATVGSGDIVQTNADQGPAIAVREAEDKKGLVAIVTDTRSGRSTEVPLHPALIRAVDVKAGAERTAVFGESSDGVIATVFDRAGNVTGIIPAQAAAASPDGRLIAYEHYMGRHEREPRAAYAVYDTLTGRGAPEAQGQPRFYPMDGAVHSRQSDLFWVSNRVLAFLDYADRAVTLVGVEFSQSGRVVRVVRKPLDVTLLVRADQLAVLTDPARAVSGPQIRKKPGDGMELRLKFDRPSLMFDRVDVVLW